MGKLIQLPGEQWAELREPADVSERLRRPISRAMRRVRTEVMEMATTVAQLPEGSEEQAQATTRVAKVATDEDTDALNEANDLMVVALVQKWSFPQPISIEGVLDLPARAYDTLRAAVAPLVNELFVDVSPSPEPSSPFVNSNGSVTPSTEESLTPSLTSGEPSVSSASGSP